MKSFLPLLTIILALAISQNTSAQVITTIAGNGIMGYNGDDIPATNAMCDPIGLAFDNAGNIYIAEAGNNRIRKINPSGTITTIAGTGVASYNGEGIPATAAELDGPVGIAIDKSGNIYVTEGNRVRKINTAGIISTIGGTGFSGYTGDGSAATVAEIGGPYGIAVNNSGDVFIADAENHCIRKINTSGIISTVAGTGGVGYNGDGIAATSAKLNYPAGLALDDLNNLYIADRGSGRIRKIDPAGIITTIAGTTTGGYNGDNIAATLAQLTSPNGVTVDKAGNIYIADMYNHRVRKINSAGIITTIAGTGIAGYNGEGNLAINAELNIPCQVAMNSAGSIYISDDGNARLRLIKNTVMVRNVQKNEQAMEIFPNPGQGLFTMNCLSEKDEAVQMFITNVLGETIKKITTVTNKAITINIDVASGVYFVNAFTKENKWSAQITIIK